MVSPELERELRGHKWHCDTHKKSESRLHWTRSDIRRIARVYDSQRAYSAGRGYSEGAMSPLEPNVRRLEGQWVKVDAKVVADETSRRIEELISTELTKVATSEDGWDTLYVDKRDGRKWELTYPHKEWHGGGPPTLTCVSDSYTRSKYKL